MKKVVTLMMVAALAIAVCVSGCKPKGGEAKKDEGKAAPGAATQEQAAPTSGVAAYGDEICTTIKTNPDTIGALFSSRFMALTTMTSAQEKAMPKEELEKMIKGMEDGMKNAKPANPKETRKVDCKILETKDMACDDIYARIDTEGTMGMKPAKGRAKEVGDAIKLGSCGLIKISTNEKGKEQVVEMAVAKADGKNVIFGGFDIKTAK